jgi:hypothetical protein
MTDDRKPELDPEFDYPEGVEHDLEDPYGLKGIKWGWQPHSDTSLARIGVRKAIEAGTLNLPKAEPKPGPVDNAMGAALYRKEVWSSRPKERAKQEAEGKPYVTSLYAHGGWHCTCPGFGFRRWQKCSHVVAVEEEYAQIQRQLPAPSATPGQGKDLDPYGRPYLIDEDGYEYFMSYTGTTRCYRLPIWDRKWGGDFKKYYQHLIDEAWEGIHRRQFEDPNFDPTYGGRIYDYRRDSPLKVTTGVWQMESEVVEGNAGTPTSPNIMNAHPFEPELSTDTLPLEVDPDAAIDV